MISVLNAKDLKFPNLHVTLYGDTGSGKTSFAKTAPKPFYVVSKSEPGIANLRGDDLDYTIVDSERDMEDAVELVIDRSRRGLTQTCVIDSWTVHLEHVLRQIEGKLKGDSNMTQGQWGILGRHATWTMDRLRQANCNVIYTCFNQTTEDAFGRQVGGPMLYGRLSKTLPGKCEMMLYLEASRPKVGANVEYKLWTTPSRDGYRAKCNIEGLGLPDFFILEKGHGWDYLESAISKVRDTPTGVSQPVGSAATAVVSH